MEAAREQESTGLLEKILPPPLEDSSLKDCALPPDSIHEAFLNGANVVNTRTASLFNSDDDETQRSSACITDLWPIAKENDALVDDTVPSLEASDTMVGGLPNADTEGPCLAEKGDGTKVEDGGDAVVVGDESLGKEMKREKGCIDDALEGLRIEGNSNDKTNEEEKEGEG